MTRLRPGGIVFLLVVALMSGCADADPAGGALAGPSGKPAAPTSFAPKATVDDVSGSITGLVVDEESVPIVGATVYLTGANLTIITDPGGRFTVNQLEPATYEIMVHHFAFYQQAKKVEVKANEVSNVIFTLVPIPVDESYLLTIPRVFYIQADHDYIHFVIIAANANQTPLYTLRCNPCWYVIHIEPNATEVLSEATWNSGPGPVNTQAYNDFYKGWSDAAPYGTRACFVTLANGGGANWTADCVKAIQKETKLKVFINGGFTTVSVDQRINTWHTFAYKGRVPENFTALPPTQ